jgi:hypothetical protein
MKPISRRRGIPSPRPTATPIVALDVEEDEPAVCDAGEIGDGEDVNVAVVVGVDVAVA